MTNLNLKLLDYTKWLKKRSFRRHAIHLHVSKLQEENRRDHHILMIEESFKSIISSKQARMFSINNDDIVVVYEESCKDEIVSTLIKLKFKFTSDPLLRNSKDFATEYNLELDFSDFMKKVQELTNIKAQEYKKKVKKEFYKKPVKESSGPPLSAGMLAKVEKALSGTDFANVIRRQSICAIVGESQPQILFDEVFVAINDLRNTILPNVNLFASPWLFQSMTETLDKRVLSNINKHDDGSLNKDFSININVANVLSHDFLKFDDNINASMRSTIVLELHMVDIFSDLPAYLLARNFAHERGYRICIDGVTHDALPYINREGLGADMVKVIWDIELLKEQDDDNPESVKNAIDRIGADKIILCRVDEQTAVELGQSLGIMMFQGRYIQKILYSDLRYRRIGSVLVKK